MKEVICKSGIKGWRGHLRKNYVDFDCFSHFSEIYNLHKRLGYDTAEEAWEANPIIEGSVNASDFRNVSVKKNYEQTN